MSHLSRRGFTMVELLVSLVMMGIVATAIYRVLVNNQRIYQAQTQRIDLSQNIRAAGTILPGELREADANEGDIITMSSTSITFRAMRWMGYICNLPTTGPLPAAEFPVLNVIMSNKHQYGARTPQLFDSVLIRYEGDEGTRNDDSWVQGRITLLAAGTCTGLPISPDGGAGLNMQVSAYMPQVADAATLTPAAPNLTNTIYAGAAIRGFVAVTYSLYKPAGDTSWYIGYWRWPTTTRRARCSIRRTRTTGPWWSGWTSRCAGAPPSRCAASAAARCWEPSWTAWWCGPVCGTTGASSLWGRRLLQERDV